MEVFLELILTLGCGLYVQAVESIAPERELKDSVAIFLKVLCGIVFFVTLILIVVGILLCADPNTTSDDKHSGVIMLAVGCLSFAVHILGFVILKCLEKSRELKVQRQHAALLGSKVCVTIDKPIGSLHPMRPDTVCAVNCGYVLSDDDIKHEAYVLGADEPLNVFIGTVKAIICRWNDGTELWVVAPDDMEVTQSIVREKTDFFERNFESYIIT